MNLDLLRTFLTVAELGSLNRAAELQHVSQSTLTRQMNALEAEIGGRLLERSPGGVALTATGNLLRERLGPLLTEFDRQLAGVRQQARGQQKTLRVGYLLSAASCYLHPALPRLRKEHPEVRLALLDQSPGEQIAALRRGDIDVALLGQAGALLQREFYTKRLAALPVVAAFAETHALAERSRVTLADLRDFLFVGAREADLPGHNQWISRVARDAGFKARFTPDAESLSHSLALTVLENAVALVPVFSNETPVPGVVFRPVVAEPPLCWELWVAWQRGRLPAAARTLITTLTALGKSQPHRSLA